jgi:integral membrane sensor domain MASE1
MEFCLVGYSIGVLLGLPMFYNKWQWWVGQAIGVCCLIVIFLVVRFVTARNSRIAKKPQQQFWSYKDWD